MTQPLGRIILDVEVPISDEAGQPTEEKAHVLILYYPEQAPSPIFVRHGSMIVCALTDLPGFDTHPWTNTHLSGKVMLPPTYEVNTTKERPARGKNSQRWETAVNSQKEKVFERLNKQNADS